VFSELGWALHCTVLDDVGVTALPPPGREQPTALAECHRQFVTQINARGCVRAIVVPTAKCGTLAFAVKTRAWTLAADVGCGVLQIVIAWGCNVEVRLAGVTTIRRRRAPILLHDDCCPVWMHAIGILHEETLATATDASIVRITATAAIISTHQL